jgi:ABC-2 type transport system ATP-binding protein
MVGLTHAQYRPVREYSKGMQRRIGIAQALINDPDLLILDEPTTGLDPIGTSQVKDLIIELGRRGKSVLLSSHLLATSRTSSTAWSSSTAARSGARASARSC